MVDPKTNQVAFRASESAMRVLVEQSKMRGVAFSRAAHDELEIWIAVQSVEQRKTRWTAAELSIIAEIENAPDLSALTGVTLSQVIARDLAETIATPGLDPFGPRGVDPQILLAKAESMSVTADLATRRAIARFWANPEADPNDPATWRDLGFTVLG